MTDKESSIPPEIVEAFGVLDDFLIESSEAEIDEMIKEAGLDPDSIALSTRDTIEGKIREWRERSKLEGKTIPFSSNSIPIDANALNRGKSSANKQFVEAIVISQLTRLLATAEYPLGRLRYNKFSYFAHRKVEDDVRTQYQKKAAGPYSPWARYKGPENIALKNGYIERRKSGLRQGLVVGPKIDQIDTYLERYSICAAVEWAVQIFKFRKNDDLELLATVDFAVFDLIESNIPISTDAVRNVIATNPEWAPKLDREIFSDKNIQEALAELTEIFPGAYG